MGRNVSPAWAARAQPKGVVGMSALMERRYDAAMIDHVELKSFLTPAGCATLCAELRQAAGAQATVLSADPGGEVKPAVRRSSRMSVPPATVEQVTALLMQRKDALA